MALSCVLGDVYGYGYGYWKTSIAGLLSPSLFFYVLDCNYFGCVVWRSPLPVPMAVVCVCVCVYPSYQYYLMSMCVCWMATELSEKEGGRSVCLIVARRAGETELRGTERQS